MRGVWPTLYVTHRSAANFHFYFVSPIPRTEARSDECGMHTRSGCGKPTRAVSWICICSLPVAVCGLEFVVSARTSLTGTGWPRVERQRAIWRPGSERQARAGHTSQSAVGPQINRVQLKMTARRRHTDEGRTHGALVRSLAVWPSLPPSTQTTCRPAYQNLRSICRWQTRSTERSEKAGINRSLAEKKPGMVFWQTNKPRRHAVEMYASAAFYTVTY